jgi:hypothetical protein
MCVFPDYEMLEPFDDLEAAIGWSAMWGVEVVGAEPTTNPGLIGQGFVETLYAVDDSGVKWTVFFDPARCVYGGAHESSEQPW